jgi:tetratricopeptide (TPR) repeat protein
MTQTQTQKILIAMSFAVAGAASCALTRPVPADVRVPPELLRASPYTAGGEPARSRYVVRMTDGQHDWEIQLPEIATAYEVKVPMAGTRLPVSPELAGATAADREILEEREAARRAGLEAGAPSGKRDDDASDEGGEGVREAKIKTGGAAVQKARAPEPPAPGAAKPSYLLTLAKVKELYRTRKYELALVELGELERQYPDDERILSMKGSLYERLGNKNLAREAWQQALTLNPFNLAVLEALQRLGK